MRQTGYHGEWQVQMYWQHTAPQEQVGTSLIFVTV